MAHLIDKDAVLAMVEERRQLIRPKNDSKVRVADVPTHIEQGWLNALTWVRDSINSLEVKEVDLNEEIEKCLKRHSMLAVGKKDFTDIAKYFFELGLKTQKGEEV